MITACEPLRKYFFFLIPAQPYAIVSVSTALHGLMLCKIELEMERFVAWFDRIVKFYRAKGFFIFNNRFR